MPAAALPDVQLPAAKEENLSDVQLPAAALPDVQLPAAALPDVQGEQMPAAFQAPEVPAKSEEAKEEESEKDGFQELLKDAGFVNPKLFTNPLGKTPKLKQKLETIYKIKAKLAKGETVYVEATMPNGDYPSRVRRDLGEKFQLKAAEDFSAYWMKLVE